MPETQELDLSRLILPIHSDDHVHGPADASYTLVEYGDYECPACGQLFGVIRDLQAELGNTLRIAFRHYPFSQAFTLMRNRRLSRRLKGFRRIFSRFEKLDVVFIAFLCFALIVEALRIV